MIGVEGGGSRVFKSMRPLFCPNMIDTLAAALMQIGMTSMKRLGRFLMAALKVTLGFFVWLFRAVFKWVT